MTSPFSLSGKVAIVTGSSRGIGEAIARSFAEAGASVVVVSRSLENAQPIADSIAASGGSAIAVACHTGRKEQILALVQHTVDKFGTVDILVNNAATNPHFGNLLDASDEQWQKTIQTNIMGYFWLIQAVAPLMTQRGSGKIINISSVAGITPGQFMGIYSVTKAAVIMLTQALAQELGPQGVQVNAIAPGLIETKFSGALLKNDQLVEGITSRAGRVGQPGDITGAALYFASSASDYTNGHTLVVDGGIGNFGVI